MDLTTEHHPEWPPASVWREVADAALVGQELHALGHEVHFEIDEASGRLAVEMRDLEGNVISSLSPSQVVSIASGALED